MLTLNEARASLRAEIEAALAGISAAKRAEDHHAP